MNRFVKIYEDLLYKYPQSEKESIYVAVTSMICINGTIDDLKMLNEHYNNEINKKWEEIINETNKTTELETA